MVVGAFVSVLLWVRDAKSYLVSLGISAKVIKEQMNEMHTAGFGGIMMFPLGSLVVGPKYLISRGSFTGRDGRGFSGHL